MKYFSNKLEITTHNFILTKVSKVYYQIQKSNKNNVKKIPSKFSYFILTFTLHLCVYVHMYVHIQHTQYTHTYVHLNTHKHMHNVHTRYYLKFGAASVNFCKTLFNV